MKPQNEDKTEEEKLEEANKAAAKQNIANIEKDRPEPKPEPKPIVPPGSLVDKPKSLMEKMDSIDNLMKKITEMDAKKLKKKSFKLPLKVKRTTRNLTKMMEQNKVQALILKNVGGIQTTIAEISMGRIIVGDLYWDGTGDDYLWPWLGKIPTVILPEWDMRPLSRKMLMEKTIEGKTGMHAQTIIIRAIEAKEAAEKMVGKGINPMMIIVIAVVGIIAYYLFFGG